MHLLHNLYRGLGGSDSMWCFFFLALFALFMHLFRCVRFPALQYHFFAHIELVFFWEAESLGFRQLYPSLFPTYPSSRMNSNDFFFFSHLANQTFPTFSRIQKRNLNLKTFLTYFNLRLPLIHLQRLKGL